MSCILVVDDDPDIRLLVRRKLELAGHQVWTEPDGPRAMATAARIRPDLVVLDWMLPGMSGLDVAVALRADPELAGVAIVLLTARSGAADRDGGFAAGVDHYVMKPFSPHELLQRIEGALAARARHRPATAPVDLRDPDPDPGEAGEADDAGEARATIDLRDAARPGPSPDAGWAG